MINRVQLLSLSNLRAGIQAWIERPGWTEDFSAPLYTQLQADHSERFTEAWWSRTVDRLSQWKALRPRSKAEIFAAGRPRLRELEERHATVAAASDGSGDPFDRARWSVLRPLFELAHGIKGSSTPVFGSKFCHFLLPDLYPVIDGEYTGLGYDGYSGYWHTCHDAWHECRDRDALVREVARTVPEAHRAAFPWGTKIVELCAAGRRKSAKVA